jgi:hypothetical protein
MEKEKQTRKTTLEEEIEELSKLIGKKQTHKVAEKHEVHRKSEKKELEEAKPEAKEKHKEEKRYKEQAKEEVKEEEKAEASAKPEKSKSRKEDIKTKEAKEAEMPYLKNMAEGVEISFPEGTDFKNFIKSLGLETEANIEVRKEGLRSRFLDSSGISMTKAELPSKFMEKYEVKKEGVLGLNVKNLREMLNSVKKGESVTLVQTDNELKVHVKGKSGDHENVMRILDLPVREEREPSLEFSAKIDINAKQLSDALRRANFVNRYVKFSAKDGTLMLSAKGDAGNFEEKLPSTGSGSAEAQFNIDYLKKMLAPTNKDTAVELNLKTNEPLKMEYNLTDKEANTYWLAPYMEDQ